MAKTTRCLTFAPEASQPLGVSPDFGRKNFDSDAITEQDVTRAVNCAHTAFAEQRLHLVLAIEHGVDDGSRIRLEDLAIDCTEAYGVVVFCFAGGAIFHGQSSTGLQDFTGLTRQILRSEE